MTQISPQKYCTWCILLAAGSGTRLRAQTGGCPKQFLSYKDQPLYLHAAQTFARHARLKGIIFVFPSHSLETELSRLQQREVSKSLGIEWKAVAGGERRQDSVYCALKALPPECTHVLVHDSARPFVSPALIERVHSALVLPQNPLPNDAQESMHASVAGIIPALPVVDTIKEVHEGSVVHTPERSRLMSVQTPQGFVRSVLLTAHERAQKEDFAVTDDASMLEKCGFIVRTVLGEAENSKITHEDDLMKLQEKHISRPCSGFGYDVHRFATAADVAAGKGRPLKLGGVPMDGALHVLAHSDGDVLLHALMDALLGAAALGDIGLHFPDTSASFACADSAVLLQEVLRMITQKGLHLHHVDLTVITQKPKVGPRRTAIQKNIAHLLSLPLECVNVKATTEEGLGFTGEGAGIKAVALVNATMAQPIAQSTMV